MRLVNMTPHEVNDNVTGKSYPPSGGVARVEQTLTLARVLDDGTELFTSSYGKSTGLPAEEAGTMLIVSALVRLANPDRGDLLSPGKLVRDGKGRIVGCEGFEVNEAATWKQEPYEEDGFNWVNPPFTQIDEEDRA